MSPRLVAVTYVDHQAVVGYPIALATQDLMPCERLYWLCGTAEDAALLEAERQGHPLAERIEIDVIGARVVVPGDIAQAQNASIDWVRARDAADFLLLVHADIWVRPSTAREVQAQCARLAAISERKVATSLTTRRITMYHQGPPSVYGVTLLGRESGARFVQDGSYTDYQATGRHPWPWPEPPEMLCLELGYWSVERYGRHMLQHAETWKHPLNAALAAAYSSQDRAEFVRLALRRLRTHEYAVPLQLVGEADPDMQMLCGTDWSEYHWVREIAAEL